MRATLIILKNKELLLIRRIKNWREYYVLPWWTKENNETINDTAIREAKEETNLDIIIEWNFKLTDEEWKIHQVFLINKFFWEIKLWWPEKERVTINNKYYLEWYNKNDIDKLNLFPVKMKEYILNKI